VEILALGAISALAFVLSTLLWHVHVHPEVVLSMFDDSGFTAEAWGPQQRQSAVRLIRWTLGVAVFAVGFIAGAALSFLSAI
jgi:hypothetical protein